MPLGEGREVQVGLRLDFRDTLICGGESGATTVGGDAEESPLIQALRHDALEMPANEKLPDPCVGLVKTIESPGEPAGTDHWAFQPVEGPVLPAVLQRTWPILRYRLFHLGPSGVRRTLTGKGCRLLHVVAAR